MPRSRSPRRPDKSRGTYGRRDKVRHSSPSPRRRSRSYSPRRKRSRSYSPRRRPGPSKRSPSPRRKQPPQDRRPVGGHNPAQRRYSRSPPPSSGRHDMHRKPAAADRARERTPSPAPMGLAHMDQVVARPAEVMQRVGRISHGGRQSPDRYQMYSDPSPPRKTAPSRRSPPPIQTASYRGRSQSPPFRAGQPDRVGHTDRPGGINTVTLISPAVRRPLLTDRFREEDQIGPLHIDDNITIGIHRSGSHFKGSRKNVPIRRDFDPHCFIMVRKREEGMKPIFDREEIHEFERMLAEENERRMISIVPEDDYRRTVSSGGRSDKRSDPRVIRPTAEPKIRLDPKPDPRYEKLYKETRQKEEQEHKRMERVQHNPNDLRHSLHKRRFDDSDDDEGFDARKRIEAKRKDSFKSRSDDRSHERRRSRSGERSGDRKRSIDERLGKNKSDPNALPDFKNRPDKYKYEDWKEKPEMIPKNPNYYEHDNRDDNRSFRGRGRFPRFRGTFRGRFRGRGFSNSFRGRGSYRPRGSSNYEPYGRRESYTRSRDGKGGDTWKHDLYDKLEKEGDGDVSEPKKERREEKPREERRDEKPWEERREERPREERREERQREERREERPREERREERPREERKEERVKEEPFKLAPQQGKFAEEREKPVDDNKPSSTTKI